MKRPQWRPAEKPPLTVTPLDFLIYANTPSCILQCKYFPGLIKIGLSDLYYVLTCDLMEYFIEVACQFVAANGPEHMGYFFKP